MMKHTITFSSYFIKILIIAGLFIALPMLFSFGSNLSTAGSYAVSVLCFFLLVVISIRLLLGKKYLRFYIIAFIIQILIGLIHYLTFVNPDYFNTTGGPSSLLWHEYHSAFNSIERLIYNRHQNSLFFFDRDDWMVTHPEIWKILTIPTTFLGHKWMNYAPLNVFSILMASANLLIAYNYLNPGEDGDRKNARKLVMFCTAYFPLFLLNDTVWRDTFGVFLISIGLVLMTLSDNTSKKMLSLIVLVYFSFLLRNVYVFVAVAIYAIKEIRLRNKAANFIIVPIAVAAMIIVSNFFQEKTSDEYVGLYVNQMSFLALPIKILFGLIGPFPWTQFMSVFTGRVDVAYQLSDYILGVFQIGYLFAVIFNWKSLSFQNPDYMLLMGLGMALSGFISNAMHIGYIAEGVFFTLPWFYKQMGSYYKRYFIASLAVLSLLNIVTGIVGSLGFADIWH